VVQIRLHGRGGQGTVVASQMLARAAMIEGRRVQAFPEFGVERRGAPVTAFLRVADRPIHLRCKVDEPDHLLVLDPLLLGQVELPADRAGWLVVNTAGGPASLDRYAPWRVATVDATHIARARGIGGGALPIVNSPMAGAFARVTGLVGLDALLAAVRESAPAQLEANVAAAEDAWEAVEVAPAWHAEALARAFEGGPP
jgi:2-oxoacid:acceptor oxidoreductase gamma subunit (pyruvate/2-ketoisovalerate family)